MSTLQLASGDDHGLDVPTKSVLSNDILRFETEVLLDVLGQSVINLRVSRNRLLLPCGRIEVYVVAATVTQKYAALLLQLANELAALHNAISLV